MGSASAGEVSLSRHGQYVWETNKIFRIRSANILLITVKALANEVAKNLVLAGIGSLTIIDHEPVTETDLDAQFFLEEAHKNEEIINQGKNVHCPSHKNAYGGSELTKANPSAPKLPVLKSTA